MVRETGGLKDTVEAYNEFEHTGTGFSFHNYNAHEMLYMIRYACKIYFGYPSEWMDIVKRAMAMDYSWAVSAKKYATLYEGLYARSEKQREQDLAWKKEYEEREQKRLEAELRVKVMLEEEKAAKEAESQKAKSQKAKSQKTEKSRKGTNRAHR